MVSPRHGCVPPKALQWIGVLVDNKVAFYILGFAADNLSSNQAQPLPGLLTAAAASPFDQPGPPSSSQLPFQEPPPPPLTSSDVDGAAGATTSNEAPENDPQSSFDMMLFSR